MEDAPINVWNEITISGSGVGVTLYSETAGDTPVVEDETWFTFDELEGGMLGEIVQLNLSDESRERLVEAAKPYDPTEQLETAPRPEPEVGQIMVDTNPPKWAHLARVKVVRVLSGTAANHYVIDGERTEGPVPIPGVFDKTVADANPEFDPDDHVIEARYFNEDGSLSDETYAFPSKRLEYPY